MATHSNLKCISLAAAGDLSAVQFYCMKISAADTVTTNDTAGGPVIGVLQNKPSAAGQAAEVAYDGVVKVVAGAAVTAGAFVKSLANGKIDDAVASTVDTSDAGAASDPVVGSHVLGIALDAAAADGDIIRVLITHSGAVPTTSA